MKGFLSRHSELLTWLAGIGIPLALVIAVPLSTFFVTRSIEGGKLDSEYIRIALGILNKDGTKKSDDFPLDYSAEEMALRRWAVRLLNQKSPEKFSTDEQHALLKVGTFYTKDGAVWTHNVDGSWDVTSPTYNFGFGYDFTTKSPSVSPRPKKIKGCDIRQNGEAVTDVGALTVPASMPLFGRDVRKFFLPIAVCLQKRFPYYLRLFFRCSTQLKNRCRITFINPSKFEYRAIVWGVKNIANIR